MGTVYLAYDDQLNREVALKVPQIGGDEGPDVRTRFLREARAAATLNHPGICQVYDVGEIDGVPYLTMAFVEGKVLSALIVPEKPWPERKAVGLVKRLAATLNEAHAKGIIHRDIKPSNVMINLRGEPIIMDFGLARDISRSDSSITASGQILGTPAYMPPEQAAGDSKSIGPASDVYSLGVILYELIAGEPPFEGNPAVVLGQVLHVEPVHVSKLRPDVHLDVAALIHKAMAKSPALRYASMSEFEAALGRFLRGDYEQVFELAAEQSTPQSAGATTQTRPAKSGRHEHGDQPPQPKRRTKRRSVKQGLPLWAWVSGATTFLVLVAAGVVFVAANASRWFESNTTTTPFAEFGKTLRRAGTTSPRRVVAVQAESKNHLKRVGLAIHNHHDAFGYIPVNGLVAKPGPGDKQLSHSWMTRLLPYVERADIYDRVNFNEPWTSPGNKAAFAAAVTEYHNPGLEVTLTSDGYAVAHYAGNLHVFSVDAESQLRKMSDGMANTIAAGESSGNYGAWGSPQNLRDPISGINRSADGFGGPWETGAHFLFADGIVRFLSKNVDAAVLKALSTPNGREIVDVDQFR